MFIPLDKILIDPNEEQGRIRESASLAAAVTDRVESILENGQLQPILVERLATPVEDKEWKLIDGQVRWTAITALNFRLQAFEPEVNIAFKKNGMKAGMIEASVREDLDPIQRLKFEFDANEQRANFTWKEKGIYVRRIHEMLKDRAAEKGEKWTAKQTALYIGISDTIVGQYLELTDGKNKLTQSASVQSARSAAVASKQLKIEKAKEQRRKQAATDAKRAEELISRTDLRDYEKAAELSVYKGDAREWIKTLPDGVFDWFHWDPPYGGREGEGGAFAGHKGIQVDISYCLGLMERMLPEIHRVLREGAWLAFWYTPVQQEWVRLLLQGHRFKLDGHCQYCDWHIVQNHLAFSQNNYCRRSPFAFWVNPYPNIWYKPDRVADGHEITRFLIKQSEPFFFAGKIDASKLSKVELPILQVTGRGNVFTHPMPSKEERRHVHHKPVGLLKEILSTISVPGSLGGDAGSGGGAIIEAANQGGRRILTAEIDEHYWDVSYHIALEELRRRNFGPHNVAEWLVP